MPRGTPLSGSTSRVSVGGRLWPLAGLPVLAMLLATLLAPRAADALPDDRCVVRLAGSVAPVKTDGTFALGGAAYDAERPAPVRVLCDSPAGLLIGASQLLRAIADDARLTLPSDGPLVDLRIVSADDLTTLDDPDQTLALTLLGRTADGRWAAIEPAAGWRSSTPCAAVDAGAVRARCPGIALIEARHEGLTAAIRLTLALEDDRDGDGLPDVWEAAQGLDPDDPTDGLTDLDRDGLDAAAEYAAGTSATVADTDGDGLLDGAEIAAGTDPREADTDGDGLLDGDEATLGLDGAVADIDGDGLADGVDRDPHAVESNARIIGRVLGPDGAALAGARVELAGARVALAAESAPDGAFALTVPGDAAGRIEVRRKWQGAWLAGRSDPVAAAPGLDVDAGLIALVAADAAVIGTVYADGGGVPDARVTVIGVAERWSTVTDAAGAYAIGPVFAGALTVEARDPYTGRRGRATGVVDGGPIDVYLQPLGSVGGRVFNADGSPAGVGLSVALDGPIDAQATTDAAGRFRVGPLPAGDYVIEVSGGDARGSGAVTVVADATAAIEIRLSGRGRVSGLVERIDGALVGGADVQVFGAGPYGGRFTARTDPRGAFLVDGVFVGPVEVTAVAGGQAASAVGEIRFTGDEARVVLTLGAAGAVGGVVRDPDGAAIAADVSAAPGGRRVAAGADGLYRLDGLVPGIYTLTATAADGRRGSATVEVLADAVAAADIDLIGRGDLAVLVFDAAGRAVIGAVVEGGGRAAVTDAEGLARLRDLDAGPTPLSVTDPRTGRRGAGQARVVAGDARAVALTLEAGGTIRGRVVAGGAPVAGYTVRLGGPPERRALADPDFAFADTPLAGGPYALDALDGAGRVRARVDGLVFPDGALDGAVIEVDLELAGLGALSGTVRRDGAPAARAGLTLTDALGAVHRATADDGGRYRFESLPAGPAALVARADGALAEASASIVADAEARLDLDLVADALPVGEAIAARLYDANGFEWNIAGDGSLGAPFAAARLALTAADETRAFAAAQGRLEQGGREAVFTGAGPAGLSVERRVLVPADGYAVRHIERVANPTDAAIDVTLSLRATLPASAALVVDADGDGAIGDEPWAVFDDATDADPFLTANLPALIVVGAVHTLDGATLSRDRSVRIEPGAAVYVVHFTARQLDRISAVIAAGRLLAVPPELRIGLDGLDAPLLDGPLLGPAGPLDLDAPLDLEPLPALDGVVTGRVFEGDGATPVPGASVEWRSLHPLFGRTRARVTDGAYTVVGAATGAADAVIVPRHAFEARATHPTSGAETALRVGDFPAEAAPADPAQHDLRFAGLGLVAGTVTAFDGRPASGTVHIGDLSAAIVDGRFALGGLAPGGARVEARSGGLTTAAEVDVPADGRAEVALVFGPVGGLDLTVTDGAGQPADQVAARVLDADGRVTLSEVIDGRARFDDLPPGPYRAEALEPLTGIWTGIDVDVVGGARAAAAVQLIGVGAVRVTVTVDAAPTADVTIQIRRGADGPFLVAGRTAADGALRIPGVPLGPFAVRAVDPAGFVAAADGVMPAHGVTVDLPVALPPDTPPTVDFVAPAADAEVLEGSRLAITVEAADDRAVERVELFADGVSLGLDRSAPYAFTYAVPLGDGPTPIALRAVATDGRGQSNAAERTITRIDDRDPPTVNLLAPAAEAEFIEGAPLTITAEAEDAVRVTLLIGGEPVAAFDGPPYSVTVDAPAPGETTVRAEAIDGAGNPASDARPIRIVADRPPTIAVTEAPADPSVELSPVRIVVEAADDRGDPRVELRIGGEVVDSLDGPPYVFERLSPAAADGPARWVVRAVDVRGQTAEALVDFAVLPEAPPTVELTAPEAGFEAFEGATFVVSADADDDRGIAAVRFALDGEIQAVDDRPPYQATLRMPAGGDGEAVELSATAVDLGGNTVSDTRALVRLGDDTPPTGRIVRPTAGQSLAIGASDVVFVIDRSDDTVRNAEIDFDGDLLSESRLFAQVAVVRAILEGFDPAVTRVGVVDYADRPVRRVELTDDYAAVNAGLDAILADEAVGQDLLDAGFEEARDMLVGPFATRAATPAVFLVAGGVQPYPEPQIARFLDDGAVLNAVRVGPFFEGSDQNFQQMAGFGGSFAVVDDVGDLATLGRNIAFGSDALVVSVEADDDVAVRRVDVELDAEYGLFTAAATDESAPYNLPFALPALDRQLLVELSAEVEDYAGNRGVVPGIQVFVDPADTTPRLRGVSAFEGSPGDEVIIVGRFFDPIAARNRVTFAGVAAEIITASKVELRVVVPDGAVTGDLIVETAGQQTFPIEFRVDADGDGLGDGREAELGTDPRDPDTDDDGLTDGEEVELYGTDPLNPDTDGDGLTDGYEVANGYDPVGRAEGLEDPDGDGLKTVVEAALGTDPNRADTDGDGLGDGEEVRVHGTDPLDPDPDGGGANDRDEITDGTDPFDPADDQVRVPLPQLLEDGVGFQWDLARDGRIAAGTDDAWQGGLRLTVDGEAFPAVDRARDRPGSLVLGPATLAGLRVERRVRIAEAGFARYLEVLDNPTLDPITARVRIESVHGAGAATRRVADSAAPAGLRPDDDWFLLDDDVDGDGALALGHAYSGPRAAVEPDAPTLDGAAYGFGWTVTVPPGEQVALLHFAIQRVDRLDGTDSLERLRRLEGDALTGLTPAEQAAVVDFVAYLDTDFDGLPDADEVALGTDPEDPDTDADGLRDGYEVRAGLDPFAEDDLFGDPDGDGLFHFEEDRELTDPFAPDTDQDGLLDGDEVIRYGSSPLWPDTDFDGLGDRLEVFDLETDPTRADTDGDGRDDGDEFDPPATDPRVADTDEDSMPDGYEIAFGFDPTDPADGALDADGDGLDNAGEFAAGSDPRVGDTDGDGLPDGLEGDLGTSPLLVDSDQGGRSDSDELWWDGTDPTNVNSELRFQAPTHTLDDGDGFPWDVDASGEIDRGRGRAWDDGLRLFVDDRGFPPVEQLVELQNGRELRLGPWLFDDDRFGLRVWRRVYVPPDAPWARFIEIVENPTDAAREVELRIQSDLGLPRAFEATSDGDLALGLGDRWIVTGDGDDEGAPAVLHLFADRDGPLRTHRVLAADDRVAVRFPVRVAPGEAVWIVHYAAQADTTARAVFVAGRIDRLNGRALQGIAAADLDRIANIRPRVDADGDGLDDDIEAIEATGRLSADSDSDGMDDRYEVERRDRDLDPRRGADAAEDPDGDGLDNLAEYGFGSAHDLADTDGDGLDDAAELAAGTDPNDPDTDGDGLADGAEVASDPTLFDTDGGGTDDGVEAVDGTDPNDPADDLAPPCPGEVFGEGDGEGDGAVCLAALSRACVTPSATAWCEERGHRLMTRGEFEALVDAGWQRPDARYQAVAVAEVEDCPEDGGIGSVRVPGFGDLTLFTCGDFARSCNRAVACTAAGLGGRAVCSPPNAERAAVVFTNTGDVPLSLYRLDAACAAFAEGELAAGASLALDGFVDQQWQLRDPADEVIETVTLRPGKHYLVPDVQRPRLVGCGTRDRALDSLLGAQDRFERVEDSCAPGADVQAMFVGRGAAFDGPALRAWVEDGGVVITEAGSSGPVYAAVVGRSAPLGVTVGECADRVDPAVQFVESAVFEGVAPNGGATGCGRDLFAVPGLVALGGWRDDQVSLGYVDVGAGRLWLVEADWQDAETRGAAFEASRVILRRLVERRR